MRDQDDILEKLRKIEALFAGAATPGERQAAEAARNRILGRLRSLEKAEPAQEWRFSIDNPWSRKLLVALARRYQLRPYRRAGQRRTSIMLSAPRTFVEKTLLPEFEECNAVLLQHFDRLAVRIIEEALTSDLSELEELPVERVQ